MTNGEKIISICGKEPITGAFENKLMVFDKDWWNAKYKEPTNTIDYRRAFKIACDLLNGDILYGVDTDKIHELMMQKDGVVSNSSYEEYILNHLQELDQGQYLTENCIACKYDEKEESDGEHCKKCLAGDSQFELDKEFVDQTTKNDLAHNLCDSCTNIGCEFQSGIVRTECAFYMPPHIEPNNCGNYVVQDSTTKKVIRDNQVKNELNRVKNELESTTKENLAVDLISRADALDCVNWGYSFSDIYKKINELPSVTPGLSSELEKNSKKLEKDFGELDRISRADARSLICEIDRKYMFGMSRKVFKALYTGMDEMPPITPIRPKGHWIYKEYDEETGMKGVHFCSECGYPLTSPYISFCSVCGADMREVENE